jgi:hypothetical protein
LSDVYTSPERLSREPAAPPTLLRALAGVARHEAAIRVFHTSVVHQLRLEERWSSTAAELHAQRVEREADRAEREADRVHREAARAHRAALREELTHFVRRLKVGGAPPERVLVVVKSLVAEAAKSAEPPLRDVGPLTDQVVQWSLDAYFTAA